MKKIIVLAFLFTASAYSHSNPALADLMKSMGAELAQISQQMADPTKNAASAALVDQLLKDAGEAKKLVPGITDDMGLTPDQQKNFVTAYKAALDTLAQKLLAVKQAFLANQNDVAQELRKDLVKFMGKSHKTFRFGQIEN